MTRGPLIGLGVSLIAILALIGYIGTDNLAHVFKNLWPAVALGAALATAFVMGIWNVVFDQQMRRYQTQLEAQLADDRASVKASYEKGRAVLEQAAQKEHRAEQLVAVAKLKEQQAEAKIADAERRRVNAMGVARRRQKKLERLAART